MHAQYKQEVLGRRHLYKDKKQWEFFQELREIDSVDFKLMLYLADKPWKRGKYHAFAAPLMTYHQIPIIQMHNIDYNTFKDVLLGDTLQK